MSGALYKQMMKVNLKGFLNYAVGSAFYILLMFWLYPGIAKNTRALDDIVATMPAGVGEAFNLSGFDSAEAFISGEYYGLVLVIILAIVCVQLSTQLMARMVDRGSMAYLLSTPTTRVRVAATQACVLVSGLFIIVGATTLAGFAGQAWLLGDRYVFDGGRFLLLNAAAFLMFFAVAGIAFLVSAVSNDEKKALGISGMIVFGFYSLDLLGKLGDSVSWLRDLSIFSLYRPGDIVGGGSSPALGFAALAAIGLAALGCGIALFARRDLPL